MTYVHEIAAQVEVLVCDDDLTMEVRCAALRELLRLFRATPVGPQCQEAAAEAALYALEKRAETGHEQ